MHTRFSVNLNKIALLRNSRGENTPDFAKVVQLVVDSGVDGITLHPRPDVRHATADDVAIARNICTQAKKELNIEGNPFSPANPAAGYHGYMAIVEENLPEQCTLVPDNSQQKTSDHGWNVMGNKQNLQKIIGQLKKKNMRVSIFMDIENTAFFKELADMGADCVELYTESYSQHYAQHRENHRDLTCKTTKKWSKTLDEVFHEYCQASEVADRLGLQINAGHGLNLDNLRLFLKLPHLSEVSIGHAIVCEALLYGLLPTLKSYKMILKTQ